MAKPSRLGRFFSAIWNGITRIRLALSNILFLLVMALLLMLFVGGEREAHPEKAALLLNLAGTVVDEKSQVEPLQALLGEPSPENHEVLLRDVIDAIEFARDDPAVNSLVMELDELGYVGISKTQEIGTALESFKATGKPVVAVGDFFTQDQFLLASFADDIIVNPLGGVGLEGFSSYRNYFRETLEKLSVSMHVFHAGEFKSIAEPFLRDDMSPGERLITGRWLEVLWGQYAATVEAQRELPPGTVNTYVNNFARLLAEQGGDTAALALKEGLVDKVLDRAQANDYLVDLVGASNDDGLYEAVLFEPYVRRMRPSQFIPVEGDRVAVITAEGNIVPGDQPPGTIGGDSLADLISTTAETDGVRAIVLRVNSGGGSVFASEVIRQELLRTRAMGIPVVISMGAVAASGGYYIAAQADEIWATPGTITGSIGVFAAIPTFEQLLERAGVHTDGVGTTELAGSLRLDRPMNPQVAEAIRSGVDFSYKNFVQLVAEGRHLSPAQVEQVAEGRVWSAPDALEHGLLDGLGSLSDAIHAAAVRAGLKAYEVEYVGLPLSPRDMFLQQLADRVGSLRIWAPSALSASLTTLLAPVADAARELASLKDPRNIYVRCIPCGAIRQ
ncbi:MAG: signal peptide peptidase SppA [Gammaproteobacteria bacterium]|nr:signal peptide peptidase SppA [Gammaproteobacteria bacterium]